MRIRARVCVCVCVCVRARARPHNKQCTRDFVSMTILSQNVAHPLHFQMR